MAQESIGINPNFNQHQESTTSYQLAETDRMAAKNMVQFWLIDRYRPERTHLLEEGMWAKRYSAIFGRLFEPVQETDSVGVKNKKDKFMTLVEEAFLTRGKGETSYARDLILTQIQEILDQELSKTKN